MYSFFTLFFSIFFYYFFLPFLFLPSSDTNPFSPFSLHTPQPGISLPQYSISSRLLDLALTWRAVELLTIYLPSLPFINLSYLPIVYYPSLPLSFLFFSFPFWLVGWLA
ncbi:hypothetical protein HOY80DRAFT_535468 [Tuber brumale]|nr:hypothetical protein HOY80DRAFT_535468 [Tuber brumale]